MRFTVVGGSGFIGSTVATQLRATGHEVWAPQRDDPAVYTQPLGHVIYAAGVTADFRNRPFDTLRAHVGLLAELLQHGNFSSLLYLSSTRIYRHAGQTSEDTPIPLQSAELEDFYDLTKLTGEGLCYASGRENVRIARLSNVIGRDFRSNNFLFDLIRSACDTGQIILRSALDSAKDYILVEDVAKLLILIAERGTRDRYNVAAGVNTVHANLVRVLGEQTGAGYQVTADAPQIISPPIDISRVQTEFAFVPQDVLSKLPTLIYEYRKMQHDQD